MVARVPLTVGNKPKPSGFSGLMEKIGEKRPQSVGYQMWQDDPQKFEKQYRYHQYDKAKSGNWVDKALGDFSPFAKQMGESYAPYTGGENLYMKGGREFLSPVTKGSTGGARRAKQRLETTQRGDRDPQKLMSEQEALNRAGMETSLGSSRWVIDPETGERTLVQTLTPGLESALQDQIAGLGDVAPYQEAVMAEARKALDPVFEQELEAIKRELFGRGIPEGSEIWNDRMADFERRKNAAYSSAFNQALSQGQAVQGQQFGQLATLLSGAPQAPFTTVDVLGSYQPQMQFQTLAAKMRDAERAREDAQRRDLIGGAFSLGSAFLGGA